MEETRVIRKWFWVWEFEKEERWLNQMAASGWVLESVGLCRYTFRRCQGGEYTVRLELHPNEPEYLQFMADTGAEYLGRVAGWIYFRMRAENGSFELFSDIDSRIGHLERIGRMLTAIGGCNLLIGITNSINQIPFSWINLLCATLLMYALGRIHGKRDELKKERELRE